ncbi:MAG: hypothetical protein VW644_02870 [Alphaproteobacteria bacterium]
MSEPPNYAALARQYLDLWEEHLTAVANDPALAQQMAAMFGLMGQTMPLGMPGAAQFGATASGAAGAAADANPLAAMQQAMAQMMAGFNPAASAQNGTEKGQPDERSGSADGGPRPTTGAAAVAAAPGDGDERLDELARRLAAVEAQLAELAAGSSGRSRGAADGAGGGKGAGTKPRAKRKSD